MSTIQYKCNVCKKTAELIENQKGLTVPGKCVLTNGCIGRMLPLSRNPYNVRENYDYYLSDYADHNDRNKFYKHTQNNKNRVWKIAHDLNNHPFVVVFIKTESGIVKLDNSDYEILYNTPQTINIKFQSEVSGYAHCVARTSNNDPVSVSSVTNTLKQITVGGTFTFAVPKFLTKLTGTPTVTPTLPLDLFDNGDIELEIGITKPNEEEIVCFETIPNIQVNSPWRGTNEIIVRNRRNYYVKMKNLLQFTTFDNANLSFKDIPDGTKIRFLRVDYGTGIKQKIPSRGVFVLLSNSPHAIVDKDTNNLLDLGEIIETEYEYMTYYNGEIYIDGNAIERTYPEIRKVS